MALPLPQLPQSVHDVSIDNTLSKPVSSDHSWTYPGLACGVLIKPQFSQSVLYAQAQSEAFQQATTLKSVTQPLIAAAEKAGDHDHRRQLHHPHPGRAQLQGQPVHHPLGPARPASELSAARSTRAAARPGRSREASRREVAWVTWALPHTGSRRQRRAGHRDDGRGLPWDWRSSSAPRRRSPPAFPSTRPTTASSARAASPGGCTRTCPAPVSGLRSLLLQALHPLAMAGVDQHSQWRDDPADRFATTAAYVLTTTYGDRAAARAAADAGAEDPRAGPRHRPGDRTAVRGGRPGAADLGARGARRLGPGRRGAATARRSATRTRTGTWPR